MSEFKVGEKVRVLAGGEGVVTYGPFNSTFNTYKMYVVKQDGDEERAFKSADLEPLPKFAVGDKVTAASGVNEYTLHAGPFNGGLGGHFWVLERPDGTHVWAHADSLTKVDDEPADGYAYEGVVYEYGVKYTDNDGDPWTFKRSLVHGQPVSDDSSYESGKSLGFVVDCYSPLTKQ